MSQSGSLIGTTLGQYQILDELGRGGMSVVYKAWQPSLRRYVALKVLQPHLTNDWEFVQRFQQEAIVAANLRHPNIVTIYEVAQQDRQLFIAMEFVEGRSLEAIIKQEGALTLPRTVALLRQVAAALDYAHERRFVHRDIKPANIMVTPDERVVITDFGIAKAMEGSGATARITQAGSVLGTLEYMAPEQIQGQPPDYRADLYSLGIVAYEMLTGRIPFDSPTTASLLYAQVNLLPPDVRQLAPALPPSVAQALARMLAKSPADRFPSAGAFVEALSGTTPAEAPKAQTAVLPPGYQPAPQPWPATVPMGTDCSPAPLPASTKKQTALYWGLGAIGCGTVLLFLLLIGFLFGDKLLQTIKSQFIETPTLSVPRITFVSNRDGNMEIYTMNIDGTGLINLTHSPSHEYWPQWSPDFKRIAFHVYEAKDNARENADIYIMSADGTNWIRLTHQTASEKFPSWSPNGTMIVFCSNQAGNYDIYTMHNDGSQIKQITDDPGKDYFPMWSPKNDEILFESDRTGNNDIYIMKVDGSNLFNLTQHPALDTEGAWSPIGDKIAFSSDRSGQREIWVINRDGSNLIQLTREGGQQPRWSTDGTKILFVSSRGDGTNDNIYIMKADGTEVVRLTTTEGQDMNPVWGP